ncbi:MAG TPA: peptidoglycan DD-metalloendopeptidase family protein [Candidatus Faecousia intestinigallinarum]|nr:peptidoglycan DD-metalloendopeptidase family protein [Candidatus Faecousia intestinigallinarum]
MAEPNQDLQKLASAANSAKNAAKAVGKAAVGNVVGAAVEVLKDENLRRIIIAVVLLLVFGFLIIGMMVGAAIVGTIEALVESWNENWDESYEQQGLESNGSILYMHSTGILKAEYATAWKTITGFFKTDRGDERDNADLGGTGVTEEDYDITIDSVKDQEALVGADGALMRRLEMIQRRIKQRGEQLESEASAQYSVEALGIAIAEVLSTAFTDPVLFNGIDYENSSIDIDTSAFDLTDIQALKVLAAYTVQHDCDISSADMWDLMDYCGWYGEDTSELESDDSLYNTKAATTMQEEIGGVDSLAEVFTLSAPSVPTWTGTCAPQWYYEEIAQLADYREKYEQSDAETQAAMTEIPMNSDGDIDVSKFAKLNNCNTFGLVDKMFTATTATLTVSRTEYHGVGEGYEEFIANFPGKLQDAFNNLYADGSGEAASVTVGNTTVYRSKRNAHYAEFSVPKSYQKYVLRNLDTGWTSPAYFRPHEGDVITFSNLNPETTYSICEVIQESDNPIYAEVNSFNTFPNTVRITHRAYQLRLNLKITYAARSIDSLILDVLGLWPDDLSDTEIGADGFVYAYGNTGNPNLLSSWEDTCGDATFQFSRLTGYQDAAYEDVVLGLATSLGFDTTSLQNPDYGFGSTIVSMALMEYEYYQANNLHGGERYWNTASPSAYDPSVPWDAVFVNSIASLCGFNWYTTKDWPTWPGGVLQALTQYGKAASYDYPSAYYPVPGDLLFLGVEIGCAEPTRIGIVEYVDNDGRVHTIEGDTDNEVQRVTYPGYKLGTEVSNGQVISHYLHPNYPSPYLADPDYLSISGLTAAIPNAHFVDSLFLVGLPRFRESQMAEVLDELAVMYPELYSDALRRAYPHALGGVRVDGKTWLIPVEYTAVTSPFGMRNHPIYGEQRHHNGIDLGASQGLPIYAPRSGKVIAAAYNNSAGNYVMIDHGDGYVTTYMHQTEYIVSYGEEVYAGQVIGYVGSTGDSTGPHLHYQITRDGTLVDPARYLGIDTPGATPDRIDGNVGTEDLMDAWNEVLLSGKKDSFSRAQMEIAAKLYVQPVSQSITVRTRFNWSSTPAREELLWGIVTTSDQQEALIATLTALCSGLSTTVSDQELLDTLATTLRPCLEENAESLWPKDSTTLRTSWIDGILELLDTLRSAAETPPLPTIPTTVPTTPPQ